MTRFRLWTTAACRLAVLAVLAAALAHSAQAGKADVLEVAVDKTGKGFFTFNVTVKHADTGWKHYADKWEVIGPDGKALGTRVLYHPHETEQPFTRSLSGVKIPETVKQVTVRAHDSVHGWGGKAVQVTVPH